MDDFEYRVGKLRLMPGDVLIVQCAGELSQAKAERISRCCQAILRPTQFWIIDESVDLSVLTKADIEARLTSAAAG